MKPDRVPGNAVMVTGEEMRSQPFTVMTCNLTSNGLSATVGFSKSCVKALENPGSEGRCVPTGRNPKPCFSSTSQIKRSTTSGCPETDVLVKFTVRILHPDKTSWVKLAFGMASTWTGKTRISEQAC